MTLFKICSKCKQSKPLEEFRKHHKTKLGYANKCKACEMIKKQIKEEQEGIFLFKKTCNLLKQHHEDLKYDPERLTTDFLQNIIGTDCTSKRECNIREHP